MTLCQRDEITKTIIMRMCMVTEVLWDAKNPLRYRIREKILPFVLLLDFGMSPLEYMGIYIWYHVINILLYEIMLF